MKLNKHKIKLKINFYCYRYIEFQIQNKLLKYFEKGYVILHYKNKNAKIDIKSSFHCLSQKYRLE